ncbi:hypothetical protein JCM10908_006609 [Rhodotorula pacifica]|uniref:uncharacterized protein n=1 Tax=Rhodotorula pacifica TaxID=1495444 RepID=UPI00317E202A
MPRSEHRHHSEPLERRVKSIAALAEARIKHLEDEALAKAEGEAAATKAALDSWQRAVTTPEFLHQPINELLNAPTAVATAWRVTPVGFEHRVRDLATKTKPHFDRLLRAAQADTRSKAKRRRAQLATWEEKMSDPQFEELNDTEHVWASKRFPELAGLVREMQLSGNFTWPTSGLFGWKPLGPKKSRRAQAPGSQQPPLTTQPPPVSNTDLLPSTLAARHVEPLFGFQELLPPLAAPPLPERYHPQPRAAVFDETSPHQHPPPSTLGGSLSLQGGYISPMSQQYPQVFAPSVAHDDPFAISNGPAMGVRAVGMPQHSNYGYHNPAPEQYGFLSDHAQQQQQQLSHAVPAGGDHVPHHNFTTPPSYHPAHDPWSHYIPWQPPHSQ